MPRRKKKPPPPRPLSTGPLAPRLAARFSAGPLVFCDASCKQHGGLAVVLYPSPDDQPRFVSQQVAAAGSNALELQAAVLALQSAGAHFGGQPYALFSDNLDAVQRLNNARDQGCASDPALQRLFAPLDLAPLLAQAASINWVQGHARSRGNALADALARAAALGEPFAGLSCP